MIAPGAYGAARALRDLLEDTIDDALRDVEDADPDLRTGDLSSPNMLEASEPDDLAIEQTPAIIVSATSGTLNVIDDLDATTELWEVTYEAQIVVYVASHDITSADVWRHGYLLAVRRALLSHRNGVGRTQGLRIAARITEAYDETGQLEGSEDWMAQALLRLSVTVPEEIVTSTDVGRVEAIDVQTKSVAADVPLPWVLQDQDADEPQSMIGP